MQTELLISNLRAKNKDCVGFTAEILFNTSWQLAFTLTSKASGSSLVFKYSSNILWILANDDCYHGQHFTMLLTFLAGIIAIIMEVKQTL